MSYSKSCDNQPGKENIHEVVDGGQYDLVVHANRDTPSDESHAHGSYQRS